MEYMSIFLCAASAKKHRERRERMIRTYSSVGLCTYIQEIKTVNYMEYNYVYIIRTYGCIIMVLSTSKRISLRINKYIYYIKYTQNGKAV